MKKALLFLISIVFILGNLNAQSRNISDIEVIHFLNKTNKILRITRGKILDNKIHTGALAAAKDYQNKSILFFKTGNNQKAVNQSFIARRLAFKAYVANTQKPIPNDWKLTLNEKELLSIHLTQQKIDAMVLKEYKDQENKPDFNLDDIVDIPESN